MSQREVSAHESLFAPLNRLQKYKREHPGVVFTPPSKSLSGLWEVSLDGSSEMMFDSIEMMLRALT